MLALAVAEVLVLTGQAPDPPPAPLAPADEPLDGAAAASLAAAAAVIAPAWFFLRREIRRRAGLSGVAARGAGSATALVLALAAVALWVANPYAALLMLPAVHLWTLAVLGEPPTRRGAAALLVAGGLVAPAGVAVFYLARLSLDPLEGAWYLFLLVTGHHVGLFTALLGCVLLGALGSVVAIVRARGWERPAAAERSWETVRHAGRAALGGRLSGLRR